MSLYFTYFFTYLSKQLRCFVHLQSDLSQLLHALSDKVKTGTESLQKFKSFHDLIEVHI